MIEATLTQARINPMSIIHVNQIGANIRERFGTLVDMSDVKVTDLEQRDSQLLSRSLSAFAIAALAKIDDSVAALSVVDEFKDDGIDGFFFSPTEHLCYLVQSKWTKDGNGSVDLGSVLKFVQGVNHFLAGKVNDLGPKMQQTETRNRYSYFRYSNEVCPRYCI